MKYAQINSEGDFIRFIQEGNVVWDATHFCPASALTTEEAAQFGVVVVTEVAQPSIDYATQTCTQNGFECVDGTWQTKWVISQIDIAVLTAQAVAVELALAERLVQDEQTRIANLWQIAHDIEYAAISGSAIGLVTIGIINNKPKCLAMQAWINALWSHYYVCKADSTVGVDFASVGPCPHSVPELIAALNS